MPVITQISDVLDRVRKSNLVSADDLNHFLADSTSAPLDEDARGVLNRLTEACYLTPFQAERILLGKYKGFHLGGYVILDQLGAGGMGQVFLAEHSSMRRLAAIKVLPLPVMDDVVAKERFVREARAAATLNHPNIVKVFDLNREGKLLYLVMEFIEGVTLQQWVGKRSRLSIGGATAIAGQIAVALQHAHECSLVHRDVKPANIVVDKSGVARLLDLGLARIDLENESKLTGKVGSSILGTADYLAPEQAIDSHTVDIRADIYSLGATLYFMLAGHVMFPEGRTAQKLMWQQWKEPTPINVLNPLVPDGLVQIVHQAIAKKPDDRFQTPQEFAAALMPYAVSGVVPPADLISSPPKRRWATRAVDPNGTMSHFKLEFSPAQSAIHTQTPSPRAGLDSQLRINGPGSAAAPSNSGSSSSSGILDTKPAVKLNTTPMIVQNPPRQQPPEPAPVLPPALEPQPATPARSSLMPLVYAGLGLVIGLVVAAGLFLALGTK